MLKALELVGFKSFADKTRFEFPRGITTIVGPNGSGKSNVVDAIKWVLGEQSVKSLRGKEMADVIFNGSASRQPLAAAEATLVFDNSGGLLSLDTSEVQITRRVYRSGEGEYLINRQPCRLRDIRDLLAGTGAATEAYSVIEQGKVDVLLQSSAKDRRAIFEEAAGISRFKAKKLESLRRLERVDQNLLRLSDIVDEVENRLRGVRMQATKAQRYKEHSDRLQELRTQVSLTDWRILTDNLTLLEHELQALADQWNAAGSQADALEADALAIEAQLGDAAEAMRDCEARIAENRAGIAEHDAQINHERRRGRDLDEEEARLRRQLSALSLRAGDARQQLDETTAAATQAAAEQSELRTQLQAAEARLHDATAEVAHLRAGLEQAQAEQLVDLRAAASLEQQAAACEARIESAQTQRTRAAERLATLEQTITESSSAAEQLTAQQAKLAYQVEQAAAELLNAQGLLADHRRQHADQLGDLNQLRQRHSGATERASVLDELERRLEGVDAGVKEVLLAARSGVAGPFQHVRGMLADLFRANLENAPLLEVALGARAQHLVVAEDDDLLEHLTQDPHGLAGRVGFIRLIPSRAVARSGTPLESAIETDFSQEEGVLGRVDQWVETAPEFVDLARRLLGRTWIVERLSQALALAEKARGDEAFVTVAGELLAADGTLSVGPRHAHAGLISRRSELRVLKQQIADLVTRIAAGAASVNQLQRKMEEDDRRVKSLGTAQQQATDAAAEHRVRVTAAQELLARMLEQRTQLETEATAAAAQNERASNQLQQAKTQQATLEEKTSAREALIHADGARLTALATTRDQLQEQAINLQIKLATCEERLGNHRARLRQFEQDQQERRRAISEGRDQLAQCQERATRSRFLILHAESAVAELYLHKEALAAESALFLVHREEQREQRQQLQAKAKKIRGGIRKIEERQHAQDLAANEIRHERATLAARLREDYGIELAELEHQPSDEELLEREAIEQEIAELRRKINNIGNVNLEALDELESLESRFATLSGQFDDLQRAKQALEQIIHKINADSRRLFSETLETVKGHFQTLFRKLFGGGHADIILEEGADILDSGIEIVARPPGKEPRNISLLSGGERTLTCVALLLAIFQYRPSPFCVLDEVDAALDEANIERFIGVLQEFLAWTQFIVVTHSKKTMTCASTLYGVTMQESGVSKRVSVRFEDVTETGEILPTAIATDDTQAA